MQAVEMRAETRLGRLTGVEVKGYRSIRAIRFPIMPLTVLVGQNGVGKTNLYRSLFLIQAAAKGTLTREIAEEGGVESVLWAGVRRQKTPARLVLAADLSPFTYRVEIGLPAISQAALNIEPGIKEEELLYHEGGTSLMLMHRNGATVTLRDEQGRRLTRQNVLLPSETALSVLTDPVRFSAIEAVRREILDWRFYHDFRTDAASPLRRPCLAISTPTLAHDGHNLAAVLATVFDIKGDASEIDRAVREAFPGSELRTLSERGRSSLVMKLPDMPRAFEAHELSDGTLRYLCLIGALASYRLPGFIALNEPEGSLHPSLIAPLAGLIVRAANRSRIWVVTHSEALGAEIQRLTGVEPLQVIREAGATWIDGLQITGEIQRGEA
jgi:predicted ATPase